MTTRRAQPQRVTLCTIGVAESSLRFIEGEWPAFWAGARGR
jgi:hypothetical protein